MAEVESATETPPIRDLTGRDVMSLARQVVHVALLLAAAGLVVLEHGFDPDHPPLRRWVIHALQMVLVGLHFGLLVQGHRRARLFPGNMLRFDRFDRVVLSAAAAAGLVAMVWREAWLLFELALCVLMVGALWRLNVVAARRFFRPGVLLPLSFVTLIAIGTPLLMVPRAAADGRPIAFVDALFTMTSAVCVTGLTVRDTATSFSPFGQAVIGLFIQLGGLGIIVFGSVMAMLLGARLSLRENLTLSQALNDQPLTRITSFVRFVVVVTLGLEFVGAAAMAPLWHDPTGSMTFGQRVGTSVFHSVSAFCNAGFTLTSDSLVGHRYRAVTHLVIMPLIVLGGLGFPVLDNLWRVMRWRWTGWLRNLRGRAALRRTRDNVPVHERRLTLHSKIVLTTTAALYLYGVVFIFAGQMWAHTHPQNALRSTSQEWRGGESVGRALADASFTSVTSRTAGFNSLPMEEVEPVGRFTVMTLMVVGASPGGTGGGVKTTTLAVLILTVVATVRGRPRSEAFGREIMHTFVRRAATLLAVFLALVTVSASLLLISENDDPFALVFEALSAASTTGLSLGVTPNLTVFGKVVVIVTMFLGRVGPLVLLGVLMFGVRSRSAYSYPRESIDMG